MVRKSLHKEGAKKYIKTLSERGLKETIPHPYSTETKKKDKGKGPGLNFLRKVGGSISRGFKKNRGTALEEHLGTNLHRLQTKIVKNKKKKGYVYDYASLTYKKNGKERKITKKRK